MYTHVIKYVHTKKSNRNCINRIILKQVNILKYLGITIYGKLKWNYHMNNLANTVRIFFLYIS